jgi:hypothetical protein
VFVVGVKMRIEFAGDDLVAIGQRGMTFDDALQAVHISSRCALLIENRGRHQCRRRDRTGFQPLEIDEQPPQPANFFGYSGFHDSYSLQMSDETTKDSCDSKRQCDATGVC